MDQDSPVATLLIYAFIIVVGSTAAVAVHSWPVTVLFCFAVISWGARLMAQVHLRHRRKR